MAANVFVITGPSGVGKDSVIDAAKKKGLDSTSMITTSTRSMRPGEAEGQPYYFVSTQEFEDKIKHGDMVEYATVYGNYYGGTRAELERISKDDSTVAIIKVDPQGARNYKQAMPDTVVTIFIEPPSLDALAERLASRATDSQQVIDERLHIAREELQHLDQWDYRIVNEEGKLDKTAAELIGIIRQHQKGSVE